MSAQASPDAHGREVRQGERFTFGENWAAFLKSLDDSRIETATSQLAAMLGVDDLSGKLFLDVGSGSGLSSLAAHRLGATVLSFDYDPQSVECTRTLQRRYGHNERWEVRQGSALDAQFMDSLPQADVVYSWGVLHHTGEMWRGIDLTQGKTLPGGQLFLAIYNDQGIVSRGWRVVKQCYCHSAIGRALVTCAFVPYFAALTVLGSIARGGGPLSGFRDYRGRRGMSIRHDWSDWLGGLPFEVASPEAIFDFLHPRGFALERLRTTNRLGCNEFILRRNLT